MGYYDRHNDSNRDAHRRGERDGDLGYRHHHEYDSFSEPLK